MDANHTPPGYSLADKTRELSQLLENARNNPFYLFPLPPQADEVKDNEDQLSERDDIEMEEERSLKRKVDEAGIEEEPFELEELIPEMKMEIFQRMDEQSRALFSLTSRSNYIYGKNKKWLRSTLTLLTLSAKYGSYDLFTELQDDFYYPYVDDPIEVLIPAAENKKHEFISNFIDNNPLVAIYIKGNIVATQKMIDSVGRYSSIQVLNVFWPIFAPSSTTSRSLDNPEENETLITVEDFTNIRRLMYAALLYSNVTLLTDIRNKYGNIFHHGRIPVKVEADTPEQLEILKKEQIEKERRNALLTALGSCRQSTVEAVVDLFDLPLSLAERRFVIVPEDAPQIPIDYLRFMKKNRCSPSASVVVCNALLYKDEALFNFAVGEVECRLRDLERALVSFATPEHRPIFDKLFSNPNYLSNNQPLERLKGGVIKEGIDFFIEKNLLVAANLRRASSKVHPGILFYLTEKKFPVQFIALLNCAVRHDDIEYTSRLTDHPEMLRGKELFALLIRYNAVKVIPELLKYNLYTIQDAVQQIVATVLSKEVPNPRTAAAACGLRQLFATLRYYLYHPSSPTTAIPVAFLLSTLSSLKPSDEIFQPRLLEEIFHLVLHSSSFSCFAAVPFPPQPSENVLSVSNFPSSFTHSGIIPSQQPVVFPAVTLPNLPLLNPPRTISFPTFALPASVLTASSPAAIVLERAIYQTRTNGFSGFIVEELEKAFDRLPGKPKRHTWMK